MASRGYHWGRHLRLTPKTFGCEQGGGEAIGEGEEGASEELGAKCDERRLKLPEEKRRDSVRAEETSSEATQRTPSLHMRRPSDAKGSEAKRPHCQSFVRSVQL